jgi:predicted transcriptional regulator
MEKLFFRVKPVKLLIALKAGPKYATLLAKEIDCTYSHTIKLLDNFKKFGLVEFEKKGRIKVIKLTSKGEDVLSSFEKLVSKFR